MKNIIKVFTVLALFAFASCTEKPGEEKIEVNDNIVFTLELMKLGANEASVKITSDGSESDTWFGFITDDADPMKAYNAKVTEMLSDGSLASSLNNQSSTITSLRKLSPYTDYTYVVFGLAKDGTLYGTPATLKFTTGLTEHDAWTVSYNGKKTYEGIDADGNEVEVVYETARVQSTDKDEKYLIYYWDKAEWDYIIEEQFFEQDEDGVWKDYPSIIGELALDALKEYIQEYNEEYNGKLTLDSMLYPDVAADGTVEDGIEALAGIYPGEWVAIAFGVDPETGRLSGLYQTGDVIIPEDPATDEYSAWLGEWTWTGANGVSWDVTFDHKINNMWFTLNGWEGWDSETGIGMTVEWYQEEGIWAIYTENFGIYQFNQGYGYILSSATYDYNGNTYYVVGTDVPLCYLHVTENGEYKAIGYQEELEDGTVIKLSYMHYIAYFGEDSYGYMVTPEEGWPTFPITITKKAGSTAATKAASAPTPFSIKKGLKNTKDAYSRAPIQKSRKIRTASARAM